MTVPVPDPPVPDPPVPRRPGPDPLDPGAPDPEPPTFWDAGQIRQISHQVGRPGPS
ncbi:MAG: hypothetical protein ACLP5E_00420 [Streptosporangiaceae bacterium]